MEILYERIKQRREELELTQDQLAALMGYKDRSMISKIEAGTVDLTLTKVKQFAKILNVSAPWLLGWSDPPSEDIRDDQDEQFLLKYKSASVDMQKAIQRILED